MYRRLAVAIVLLSMGCARREAPERTRVDATQPPTASPTASPAPAPWTAARALEAPDAATLATRLAAADRAPAEDAARVQQAAYRQLVAHPDWIDEVLARIPEEMHIAVRENVEAGAALRRLVEPRDALPPWRIVAPPAAPDLRRFYDEAAAASGVPWHVLASVNLVETRMGRIRGLSTAGARGPMQFLPSTWDAYGEGDIEDPRDSILAAGRYLAANGGARDLEGALFRYNRSRHYVRGVLLYAGRMRDDPSAFERYHHWDVYYATTRGDALLPVGWEG